VKAAGGQAGAVGPGGAAPPPTGPSRLVAGFTRALRVAGVAVPVGAAVLYAQALGAVGLEDPESVYWAGRATLVRRPEDADLYDRVFTSYWTEITALPLAPSVPVPVILALDSEDEGGAGEADDGAAPAPADEVQALRWSAVEILAERDLAALTADEWSEAQRLVSALRVDTELRPSRRTRPSRGRQGDHPDLRATFRRNTRHGGLPLERAWRETVERPRRMVFLLDVSGSMEAYSRAMARFAHAAVASRRAGRVEVFTMGTRLTRITREMTRRDPDAALRAAAGAVSDWSGGTRLSDSIGEFNDRWGVRGMARGAVVVICSDGWDRGDPERMAAEMGRLARVARRVVWVNPLKASPGYAPLARGMAAALPYVDQFVEGHSVSSLEHLAALVAGHRR
jgi:uncharacterized protein with von Willebrand factor type A (vWA) domain